MAATTNKLTAKSARHTEGCGCKLELHGLINHSRSEWATAAASHSRALLLFILCTGICAHWTAVTQFVTIMSICETIREGRRPLCAIAKPEVTQIDAATSHEAVALGLQRAASSVWTSAGYKRPRLSRLDSVSGLTEIIWLATVGRSSASKPHRSSNSALDPGISVMQFPQ